MNAPPAATGRLSALVHRWPTAVGLLAAASSLVAGADRDGVALVVAVAASCYLAAAAFGRPAMAWAWIPAGVVVVVAGRLLGLAPIVATVVAAAVLVVIGVVRGASRPALTLQTAGMLGYGAFVVLALLLTPGPGLVVAALTLVGHGVWDVRHLLRRRGVVTPSLAEACVALDVPLGLAVLVAAL